MRRRTWTDGSGVKECFYYEPPRALNPDRKLFPLGSDFDKALELLDVLKHQGKEHAAIIAAKKPILKITGVYFLIDGNDIVYVGQSEDIHARIATHRKDGVKIFTHYAYKAIDPSLLTVVESAYILTFQPKYNEKMPGNHYVDIVDLRKNIGSDV